MRHLSLLLAALLVSSCATFETLPANFLYETSLRGEQGFPGRAERVKSAKALLELGVVSDPVTALKSAYPDQKVKIRRWGLQYFNSDWTRYQVVLDADIGSGKTRTQCRFVSTDGPAGAPTLRALRAKQGQMLQDYLVKMSEACVDKVRMIKVRTATIP